MPLLYFGDERCVLRPGTHILGGRGSGAPPLLAFESSREVASIVVPESGPPTIQRLAASIVVKLDQIPIGIEPETLTDGVCITFGAHELTFSMDDAVRVGEESPASGDASSGSGAVGIAPRETTRFLNVRTGETIPIAGARVVVGRGESCDVVLHGMDVSRRHFSVTAVQGGYLLRDESANGTLVNGTRVTGTYLLGHGDVVRVGDDEFRCEMEGRAAAANSTTAPTAILDARALRSELAAEGVGESAGEVAADLEIVRGPYAGASFSIERPVCSVGRGRHNDVQIRDESVSGSHATLLRKGRSWYIVDLRSANGTFVDGSRIAGERELTTGARVKLGRVELVFRALDGKGGEPATPKRKRSWRGRLLRFISGAR